MYADTRLVVDGTTGGVLHVSVRNTSRFSVTILGLATTPGSPSSLRRIFFDADPYGPGAHGGMPAHVVTHVTLGHDEEAGVLVDVRLPDCIGYEKGSAHIYDWIPLRVRRLGVTHAVQMPLQLPLWVVAATDHKATGTCHG